MVILHHIPQQQVSIGIKVAGSGIAARARVRSERKPTISFNRLSAYLDRPLNKDLT